jgi:hypothetical protein
MAEQEYNSTRAYTRNEIEVKGLFTSRQQYPPGKRAPPVSTEQKTKWAPNSVCMVWKEKNYIFLESNHISSGVQLYKLRYPSSRRMLNSLHGLSPRANYTDRAAAAGQRR